MPISSGASGGGGTAKQSRGLPFNVGGTKRSYWPNAASKSSSPISRRRQASGATSSFEDNQNRRDTAIKKRSSSRGSVSSSAATSINDLSRDLARPSRVSVDKRQNSNNKRHKQSQVDKYKPIGHISGPSSPASTSPAALRYLVEKQQSEQQQQQQATVIINHKADNRAHRANATSELSGQNQAELKKEEDSTRENQCATVAATAIVDNSKSRKIMNSLGGQLVITGGLTTSQGKQQQQPCQADFSPVIENCANEKNETMKGCKATDQSNTKPSLISSILLGGRGGGGGFGGTSENCAIKQTSATGAGNNNNRKVKPNLSGKTNYLLGQANYHHNHSVTNMQSSQSSLLNQSLSFNGSGAGGGSSASTSASNSFANLHNNAINSHHNGLNRTPPATTTTLNISKRVNLKYVKSLIILLMSLDLMITIFVHHFSSHDEFAIMFTTHKLRFSVLNLILSAIWFIALIGAIMFDVYPILLLGCLVDIASFILLLVCSIIHFTYRIDYNTVNLTSLLLLLFSIIVLHVYLLVIAALTTYLMLAVKRRKRIQS